jgi:RNA polymerase sigma-70 factor (ECF subfamily)
MALSQSGDRIAYKKLLAELAPFIRGVVRRGLREPADAEDAVQEILIALHAARRTYDPARPFKPWLAGIIRYRLLDRQRALWRRNRHEIALGPEHETFAALAPNSDGMASDGPALHAAISALPAGQRQAIELTKLRELSLKEASAITGLSVTALKVATHRGLLRLRGLLSGGIEGT